MATVLVQNGRGIISNRILGSGTEPKYVAWGTGTTTAAAGDTALTTASSEARTSGTSTQVTTTTTNDTYQVVGTITSTQTQSIAEFALFDASTSGTLFVHGNFTAIPLQNGDSIQFTIKVSFS